MASARGNSSKLRATRTSGEADPQCVDDIDDICERHWAGIEFVEVVPALHIPHCYGWSWWRARAEMWRELAQDQAANGRLFPCDGE